MFLKNRARNSLRRIVFVVPFCLLAMPAGGADAVPSAPKPRHHVVAADDTFVDLARRYDVGYVELMAANPGVDPWVPEPGSAIVIPDANLLPDGPREGVLINLAELRLYLFGRAGNLRGTWPLGIGREGLETPLGRTRIVGKRVDPTWIPTPETREANPDLPAAIAPGPNNPLGRYALDLGWPTYLIHGTNKPAGVGRRLSRGCIRMYPEDIEALFGLVEVGTPVTVIDQPVKIERRDGAIHIEAHPSQTQVDQIEDGGTVTYQLVADLDARIRALARIGDHIDWTTARRAVVERLGYPVRISSRR